MTNTPVDLHHEDFDDSDRSLVWMAGSHLISEAGDLVHHHSDGTSWAPWPQDNTAELAQQARELIDHMDRALKQARRHLAEAERPARLRALRRIRATGTGERERAQ
jgi:hypothetical protein